MARRGSLSSILPLCQVTTLMGKAEKGEHPEPATPAQVEALKAKVAEQANVVKAAKEVGGREG